MWRKAPRLCLWPPTTIDLFRTYVEKFCIQRLRTWRWPSELGVGQQRGQDKKLKNSLECDIIVVLKMDSHQWTRKMLGSSAKIRQKLKHGHGNDDGSRRGLQSQLRRRVCWLALLHLRRVYSRQPTLTKQREVPYSYAGRGRARVLRWLRC